MKYRNDTFRGKHVMKILLVVSLTNLYMVIWKKLGGKLAMYMDMWNYDGN